MSTLLQQNAVIASGDNAALQFTLTDDGSSTGAATLAASARWAMSNKPGGTSVVTHNTVDGGAVISGASSNIVTVSLTIANTAQTPGIYYHELEVTDASGNIQTVASGRITIEEDQV